jgi:putative tryptophan/tyrosine transport system substrate-binding protein
MKRRKFLAISGGTALWPLLLRAQPAKSYHVAYLALGNEEEGSAQVKQRLAELGYIEGRNLVFDFRYAASRPAQLPGLAAQIVASKPDVIVAGFGTLPAQTAQAATATIPVVFTSAGDPIGAGIVKSLSRPGANVTGLHSQAAELNGKRLQILKELGPSLRTVAVLVDDRSGPFASLALRDLGVAAGAIGLTLQICEGQTADQLSASLDNALTAGATGLTLLETPPLLDLRHEIIHLAKRPGLVAVYPNRDFVTAGGLASYGADRRQLYRRAAEIVDKILKGERPADIPVEQPTKFDLVINIKAGKAMGLSIAPSLLATADEVIE